MPSTVAARTRKLIRLVEASLRQRVITLSQLETAVGFRLPRIGRVHRASTDHLGRDGVRDALIASAEVSSVWDDEPGPHPSLVIFNLGPPYCITPAALAARWGEGYSPRPALGRARSFGGPQLMHWTELFDVGSGTARVRYTEKDVAVRVDISCLRVVRSHALASRVSRSRSCRPGEA